MKKAEPAVQKKLTEKKKLLSNAELSIWLDTYDDIYSDFDSRSYSERALSDDFINEAKKMAKEKISGDVALKLLMPSQQRDKNTEEIIVKNLHAQFHKFAGQLKQEMNNVRTRGMVLTGSGLLIMIATAFLANMPQKDFLSNALRIIMEPAGWFLAWTGLDQIFSISRRKKTEFDFMSRMSHAEIEFLSF
jgi:hypothetical protein